MQRYDKHTELQRSAYKAYSKLVILTGYLIGCRKNHKLCMNFQVYCAEKYVEIMQKTCSIIQKFKQFISLVIGLSTVLLLCKLLSEDPSSSWSL